jgi:hypothetical protein
LVVNEGAEVILNRCEIKGNKNHETIGLFLLYSCLKKLIKIYNIFKGAIIKKADALIKDCKIHNHIVGGLMIWS